MRSAVRPVLALCSYNRHKYSETFIHAHATELPADVRLYWGDYLPTHGPDDRPLAPIGRVRRTVETWWPGLHPLARRLRQRLAQSWKHHGVEYVLAEYGMAGVEVAPVCTALGLPLTVHFFGYDAYRADMLGQYGGGYPALGAQAQAVVCVSRHMYGQLVRLGIPAGKLHYIRFGVQLDRFRPTRPDLNPPLAVCVGRFDETKAPWFTLVAFREVLTHLPEARLVMLGTGHLAQAAQLLAKSLGIDGAVTFAGSQSHAQVAEWLHRARLLVLPSHTPPDGDTEGTPLAILEAAATGLPVVSTRHAGIPEAVLDGQTGLLVDEHDLQGFARAWLELLRSPAQAAEWGSAGRRHIEAHYESTAQHAKLWDVITGKARPTGPDGI